MRRFGCVLLLAALAGCAKVDVEAEKAALMTADKEWSQTTKDLDKFMTYFASDATSYAPGAPAVTGTDGIRKLMGAIVGAPGVSLSWTASKAVVGAGGDIGYTAGTYEESSAAGSEKGKYVTTWKKVDGAWKVADDIFNSDAAPASGSGPHVMLAPGELKWGDAPPSRLRARRWPLSRATRRRRSRSLCAHRCRPVIRCRRTGIQAMRTSRFSQALLRSAWANSLTRAR